jgi:hypothetical protein
LIGQNVSQGNIPFLYVIFALMMRDSNWWQFQGFLKTPSLFCEKEHDFPYPHLPTDLPVCDNDDFSSIPDNLMLGKRAERFLNFYLKSHHKFRIALENFQLIENKKTLGEIDFIVEDKETNKYLHIELSYKFYLFDPQVKPTGFSQWIGPNRNDSLPKKIEKLRNKQFPLLQHPALIETIQSLGIHSDQITPTACFKAQLFVPFGSSFQKFAGINQGAIRGQYFTWREFLANQQTADGYFVPSKKEWLRAPETQVEWFTLDTVIKEIKNKISMKKSPLVWSKLGTETRSFFIIWW